MNNCVIALFCACLMNSGIGIEGEELQLSGPDMTWSAEESVVWLRHEKIGAVALRPLGLMPPLSCERRSGDSINGAKMPDSLCLTGQEGRQLILNAYDNHFVRIYRRVKNDSDATVVLKTFTPIELAYTPAEKPLKVLGTGGLTDPEKTEGSYSFIAAAHPQGRQGIVAGWVTHWRGSGVFFSESKDDTFVIQPRLDWGDLRLEAGEEIVLDELIVGLFEDARLGLEAYADAVAQSNGVQLPLQPNGYCTWYAERHGGASNEKRLPELAAFAQENLQPHGLNFIQIDDYWQGRPRQSHDLDLKGKTAEYLGKPKDAKDKWWWGPHADFTAHDPKGPYKSGMKATADTLKGMGYTPGLWLMPFAWDPLSPPLIDHQDWMVHRPDGSLHYAMWSGWALDMTHPDAREFLGETISRITKEWGYDYLKLDGLWAGMATDILYVNNAYKDDDLGGAVFHDESMTPVEAYRKGLETVRDAAGEEVYILGCNVSQNMRTMGASFGLVDAMRIGPDNGSNWESLTTGAWHGSNRYFFHNRVWHNDPDPVYVREKMPLEHARLLASWIGISGQLTVNSDWLPKMPEERLDILKKILPAHGKIARPVDLFERDFPTTWLMDDAANGRYVVGVFNWSDKETLQVDYVPEALGLPEAGAYVGYDFWADALLPEVTDHFVMDVPPASCKVIAVHPKQEMPIVLSTDRHVSQGMLELTKPRWDQEKKTLSGESVLVAGASYTMVLYAPGWKAKSVKAEQVKGRAKLKRDGALTRITFTPERSGKVAWRVVFKQQ